MRGRVGCFFIAVIIALLWGGGQNLYTALTNRTPTTLTVSEFNKSRPKAHWLKLTECRPALADSLYREKYGTIEELYVPLRAPKETGTIHVLLATKDAGMILAFQQLQKCQNAEEALKVTAAHTDKITKRQTVQGLVRYGIDLKDKDSRKLAALEKTLAPDFVIVDENKEPSMGMGLGMFIPGVLLTLFGGYKAAKS